MPGGGGALATVHSGQSQAATGQHDGSALLQPGLTCTGRTETLLSSGARHRIWANFDRRHSSPRARSDKMLTVRKLRLVERCMLIFNRKRQCACHFVCDTLGVLRKSSIVHGGDRFIHCHSQSKIFEKPCIRSIDKGMASGIWKASSFLNLSAIRSM